jgi:HAE1 family hydrophobic/amphiphilic exporter-1
MEQGQNAFEASLNSAKEISFTILAMTLSLAAVFIPLVFMSGLMGRIFRSFLSLLSFRFWPAESFRSHSLL